MYRIRVKFTKKDLMKFISHLDLLRLMERALRRSDVPLVFSQGFNPHPKISFATAVPIGLSSEGEYMDIDVENRIELNTFRTTMNQMLPKGIEIVQCQYIDLNSQALMALIDSSKYIVKCELASPISELELKTVIEEFMSKEEIVLRKTTKKKTEAEKEINIRPWIYNFSLVQKEDSEFVVMLTLATGSKGNLKPEAVIEKFAELMRVEIRSEVTRVHRIDLYTLSNQKYVTPLDIFDAS